jgi:hypothetical protein
MYINICAEYIPTDKYLPMLKPVMAEPGPRTGDFLSTIVTQYSSILNLSVKEMDKLRAQLLKRNITYE